MSKLLANAQTIRLHHLKNGYDCNSGLEIAQQDIPGDWKWIFFIQSRQFRKSNEDMHYASALFRYEKELYLGFKEHCTFWKNIEFKL